jgi:hypothetical protein
LAYRSAGHSQVTLDHGLMPGQLALVDPPCPCGIGVADPVGEQAPDLGEQAKGALVPALRQRAGLANETPQVASSAMSGLTVGRRDGADQIP